MKEAIIMLYGNIYNKFFETQLKLLPSPLAAALKFLRDEDLAKHEAGKFDINLADTPMILQVLDIETDKRENLRPEIYRRTIFMFRRAGKRSILQ